MSTKVEASLQGRVNKVDSSLGIVFGLGIVCLTRTDKAAKHEPYFDLQNEHIPESVMLKAVTEFMRRGAPMDAMHDEVKVGKVLFSFPATREIAKGQGVNDADQYGWWVGVECDSPEILAKYKSGEWTGFSIGGWATSKAYEEGTCPECGKRDCSHMKDGE